MRNIYEVFVSEIAKLKKLQGLTNTDVAEKAQIKKKTLEAFMCGSRRSESVAKAIASALKIEL